MLNYWLPTSRVHHMPATVLDSFHALSHLLLKQPYNYPHFRDDVAKAKKGSGTCLQLPRWWDFPVLREALTPFCLLTEAPWGVDPDISFLCHGEWQSQRSCTSLRLTGQRKTQNQAFYQPVSHLNPHPFLHNEVPPFASAPAQEL